MSRGFGTRLAERPYRTGALPGYAYKLQDNGYGLDVAFGEEVEADPATMSVTKTLGNSPSGDGADPELRPQLLAGHFVVIPEPSDLLRLGVRHDGVVATVSPMASTVLLLVGFVFNFGSPPKVFQNVVAKIPVKVATLHALGARPDEGKKNKLVDVELFLHRPVTEGYGRTTVWAGTKRLNGSPANRTDLASGATPDDPERVYAIPTEPEHRKRAAAFRDDQRFVCHNGTSFGHLTNSVKTRKEEVIR